MNNDKRCTKCERVKPLDEFYGNKKSKDGLEYSCKECYREAQVEYRKKNREKIRAYRNQHYKDNKEYYKELRVKGSNNKYFGGNREVVIARDGYKCTKCGVTKGRLDVHHIDGEGHGKEEPNNNMDNLITLCHRCHSLTHWEERKKIIEKYKEEIRELKLQLSSKDKEQIDCYSKDGELINEHSSTDKVIASGVVTDDKKNMLFKVGGKEIALSVYPDWLGLELRKLVDKQVELILREVK